MDAREMLKLLVILLSPIFPFSHPPALLCVLSLPRHCSPGEVSISDVQPSTRWVPAPFADSGSTQNCQCSVAICTQPSLSSWLAAGAQRNPCRLLVSPRRPCVRGVGSQPAEGTSALEASHADTCCHSSSSRRYSWPPSQGEQELENTH